MKSQDRNGRVPSQKHSKSCSHLFGCFVGKGDRENLLRSGDPMANHVGDPMGEGEGLASPRASNNQEGGLPVSDGFPLRGIQPLKERVHFLMNRCSDTPRTQGERRIMDSFYLAPRPSSRYGEGFFRSGSL